MAYINQEMQKALETFKEQGTSENLNRVVASLLASPLYVPCQWDKEPVVDENGKRHFAPGTQFQLLTIQTTDGRKLFPFFTSKEEWEKWAPSKQAKMIALSFDQYMPVIEMAKDQVEGIVIDPMGSNVPLKSPFLVQLFKQPRKVNIEPTKIQKGEKVTLKNPEKVQDLVDALCKYGKEHDNIYSIYFKERTVQDKPSHWFIIVDMEKEDPKFFQDMAHACARHSHGKHFEFLFANSPLGKEIVAKNEPIYSQLKA